MNNRFAPIGPADDGEVVTSCDRTGTAIRTAATSVVPTAHDCLTHRQLAGPALERGREGHWRLRAQPDKVGTRLREDRREVVTRTRRMLGGG